jgi:hypothetical protein
VNILQIAPVYGQVYYCDFRLFPFYLEGEQEGVRERERKGKRGRGKEVFFLLPHFAS